MGVPLKTLAGAALLAAISSAAPAEEPSGSWISDNGRVTVKLNSCGAALCGMIVAMKEPTDPGTGRPKTDRRNPDATKRERPLIGLPVLLGMTPSGAGKWSGQIYNADDGKTYAGHITTTGARSLKVQGCALGGLVCRSQNWTKVN
jgi:uncharacterized protein (DUF2147 family)